MKKRFGVLFAAVLCCLMFVVGEKVYAGEFDRAVDLDVNTAVTCDPGNTNITAQIYKIQLPKAGLVAVKVVNKSVMTTVEIYDEDGNSMAKQVTTFEANCGTAYVSDCFGIGCDADTKTADGYACFQLAKGTYYIRIKVDNGSYYNNPDTEFIAEFMASSNTVTLKVGKSKNISSMKNVKMVPTDVLWKSSNSSVCTIKNGKITAVGKGTAYVSATVYNRRVKIKVTVK